MRSSLLKRQLNTEKELQWSAKFISARIAFHLIAESGLSRKEIIKRAKISQSNLSRYENEGCSIASLNRLAKSIGKRLVINIENSIE